MKKYIIPFFISASILTSCDVKKTEKGSLPEVDVDVEAEAGNLPEYEVNWADVDLTTETRMVEVPKVVVVMEEEEVEVPVIDVEMPGEDKNERTLLVEAEVSDYDHELEIEEVRAANKKLYVIASLEKTETSLDGKTIRKQDQIDLNAPAMDVEYIIIGDRPDRVFNKNNTYVASKANLNDAIKNATVIYSE
ncbi:hypothetical protein AAT17_11095 [Nonlabens sp. MIC269]|uniref:hypothetical protein n=1 Tax=Nonlabens sp. MIC269 TaxID=1476901 RepID=UPI00071F817B|nr:hypothetical protein [Nonlabens sp. MIC269]ALM21739.1 hypothetical protein AAT17_11095 [Nonlabens sp. MIC269]